MSQGVENRGSLISVPLGLRVDLTPPSSQKDVSDQATERSKLREAKSVLENLSGSA